MSARTTAQQRGSETTRQAAAAVADQAPLRFVSAASLFDGHDAAINIMRRLIQGQGAEVIHLGHNRSVEDVVRAALQEDADAIALSMRPMAISSLRSTWCGFSTGMRAASARRTTSSIIATKPMCMPSLGW